MSAPPAAMPATRARRQAVAHGPWVAGQPQCAGAIVHTTRIASGVTSARHAFELGRGFEAGLARVLVLVDADRVAFLLRHLNGGDLCGQAARLLRLDRVQLRTQGHAALVKDPG